jgi:hypothetical protein
MNSVFYALKVIAKRYSNEEGCFLCSSRWALISESQQQVSPRLSINSLLQHCIERVLEIAPWRRLVWDDCQCESVKWRESLEMVGKLVLVSLESWARVSCAVVICVKQQGCCSCCSWDIWTVWEPRGRGTSTLERCYWATALKMWLWTLVCMWE